MSGVFARCFNMVLTDMLLSGCCLFDHVWLASACVAGALVATTDSLFVSSPQYAGGLLRKLWSVPHLRVCTVQVYYGVRVWSGRDAIFATLRFCNADESAGCGSTAVQVRRLRKAGL